MPPLLYMLDLSHDITLLFCLTFLPHILIVIFHLVSIHFLVADSRWTECPSIYSTLVSHSSMFYFYILRHYDVSNLRQVTYPALILLPHHSLFDLTIPNTCMIHPVLPPLPYSRTTLFYHPADSPRPTAPIIPLDQATKQAGRQATSPRLATPRPAHLNLWIYKQLAGSEGPGSSLSECLLQDSALHTIFLICLH